MGEDDEERSDEEESCGEEIDTQELDITTLEDRLGDDVSLDDLPDPASLDNIGLAEDIIDSEIPVWMREIDPPVGSGIDATPVWGEVNLPLWVGGVDLPPGIESAVAGSTLEKSFWENIDTTAISEWGTESFLEEIDATLGVTGINLPPGFESVLKQSLFGQPAWEGIDVPPGVAEIDTALFAGLGAASPLIDAGLDSEFHGLQNLGLDGMRAGSANIGVLAEIGGLTTTSLESTYPSVFELAAVSPEVGSLSREGYTSSSFTSPTTTPSVSHETGAGELESEISAYIQRVRAQVSFRRTYSALETYRDGLNRGVLLFIAGQLLNTAAGAFAGAPGIAVSAIGSGLAILAYVSFDGDEQEE